MKGEKANGEGRSGTGEASRRARGATGLAWAEDETGQGRAGQVRNRIVQGGRRNCVVIPGFCSRQAFPPSHIRA